MFWPYIESVCWCYCRAGPVCTCGVHNTVLVRLINWMDQIKTGEIGGS